MQVSIIGSRGYLGNELLRILHAHPQVKTLHASSSSEAGNPVSSWSHAFRTPIRAVTDEQALEANPDVVFIATHNEQAEATVAKLDDMDYDGLVIDLSRAHRPAGIAKQGWHYGAAGLHELPTGTKRIANPGCYPRATMLALHALRQMADITGPVIVDGKSGTSGAGASPRADLHHPAQATSIRPYKVLNHDHEGEIASFQAGHGVPTVKFVPHLMPTPRGMVVTAYAPVSNVQERDSVNLQLPLGVELVDEVNTQPLIGSHLGTVAIDVDDRTGMAVARCAIDNLVQGGSGTAVQNMNEALGFAPETGLPLWGATA